MLAVAILLVIMLSFDVIKDDDDIVLCGLKLTCLVINLSYQYLSDIIVPDWLLVGSDDKDRHAHSFISRFYCDIVAALSCASQCSVLVAKQNFFF